ncbi:MAG: transposase [Sulfobacillus sp.]|nr:transposase [Sulfobacillus sp.]
MADAGYGREENDAYLERHGCTAVVQYNTYRVEQTTKWKRQIQRGANGQYDADPDDGICAAGHRLTIVREKEGVTENGYRVHLREYQAADCPTCPLRVQCTEAQYRHISVSPQLLRDKQQVRQTLTSETGAALMKQRGVEVESAFGHTKGNRGFRRFLLRGLPKVQTEWGLVSIAHNLIKKAALAH